MVEVVNLVVEEEEDDVAVGRLVTPSVELPVGRTLPSVLVATSSGHSLSVSVAGADVLRVVPPVGLPVGVKVPSVLVVLVVLVAMSSEHSLSVSVAVSLEEVEVLVEVMASEVLVDVGCSSIEVLVDVGCSSIEVLVEVGCSSIEVLVVVGCSSIEVLVEVGCSSIEVLLVEVLVEVLKVLDVLVVVVETACSVSSWYTLIPRTSQYVCANASGCHCTYL
jgi:hypothetical protein